MAEEKEIKAEEQEEKEEKEIRKNPYANSDKALVATKT